MQNVSGSFLSPPLHLTSDSQIAAFFTHKRRICIFLGTWLQQTAMWRFTSQQFLEELPCG